MTIAALLLILILVVGSGTMAVLLGWMWHRISKLEGGREDRSELATSTSGWTHSVIRFSRPRMRWRG